VIVDTRRTVVSGAGSRIESASGNLGAGLIRPNSGTVGGAGSVRVEAERLVRVDGGAAVSVRSDTGGAGSVTVLSRGAIEILGGGGAVTRVTAEAVSGNGGDITLRGGERVRVRDALVTAEAQDAGGARISVAAPSFVLDGSVMNGRAAADDVPVDIAADAYVRSPDSAILSDLVTAPVEVDISGSLARLPGGLEDAGAALEQACHERLGVPLSTFVATGRGGTALAPGGWSPSAAIADRQP
jgi:hypothetical protein